MEECFVEESERMKMEGRKGETGDRQNDRKMENKMLMNVLRLCRMGHMGVLINNQG